MTRSRRCSTVLFLFYFLSSPPHPCSPLTNLHTLPVAKAINTQKQGNFSSFSHCAVAHTTANELQRRGREGRIRWSYLSSSCSSSFVVQSKTDFFSGSMLQVTLLLHLLSQAVPQTATVTTFLDGHGWTASAYPVSAPATGCTFMAGFDYKPSKYMKTQSRA